MSKEGKEKKANDKTQKKWENEIARAGGMMIKIPKEFINKTKEFNEIHDKILEEGKIWDEKNAEFKHTNDNFWYDMLKGLKESGIDVPDGNVEIGLNKEAAKDGVFIINFRPAGPNGRRPMIM